jgi:hypothetical protein
MSFIKKVDQADPEPDQRLVPGRSTGAQRTVVLPEDVEQQLKALIENFDRYAA